LNDGLENAVLRALRALDRYQDDASFSASMILILTNKIYAIKLQTRSRCQFEVAGERRSRARLSAQMSISR